MPHTYHVSIYGSILHPVAVADVWVLKSAKFPLLQFLANHLPLPSQAKNQAGEPGWRAWWTRLLGRFKKDGFANGLPLLNMLYPCCFAARIWGNKQQQIAPLRGLKCLMGRGGPSGNCLTNNLLSRETKQHHHASPCCHPLKLSPCGCWPWGMTEQAWR